MIRTVRSNELTESELHAIRRLLLECYDDDFADEDWEHVLGGWHVLRYERGIPVSHASVVPRVLRTGGRKLRTGYVEAMATHPEHRRRGFAGNVLVEVNKHIRREYELGALSDGTEIDGFYQRHGWQVWFGESSVDTPSGRVATPEEDGAILVLTTPASANLDLTAPITCDWRRGDVW
ncbi:aminoglycoside 2'-N-acetyltransferase I [Amycolatopsis arida]|uniref:Aminoglycoside 2'-N-acetyltransferase I n=1 Tax=Amycolatopsis arida TaxID=587909 RepID=A0A1I5SXE8_9PSEU|nr:GNAT family N-acetyltransferase [Amycolatopsis arida]TDX96310.1 aminoglycoside 2'-N-acetyltransferase I [Amycolatopsis arida]SFP75455.1 aminoglycoside 2'-N-acetyltransferase I [Amycolatopsis arida]